MGNVQLVTPDQMATDGTGMCLRFTQRVFRNKNPYYYNSAWEAWQNAVHKRTGPLPEDVAVPVYFEHWGTYGSPPTYANWGHVAVRFPGGGVLTSPAWGTGREWYTSLAAVERAFNCRYVGWAYDMGGLMVADVAPKHGAKPAPIIEEDPMPERHKIAQYNPNQACPAGKWTTLHINEKKHVTILRAGAKARRGVANVAVKASGEFEARYVFDTVDPKNDSVVKGRVGSVISRYEGSGIHSWPFDLPKSGGEEQRIRVQVRPVGDKPVTVTAVRPIVDYWEK